MDHSWRPRPPIQGNTCPTCSISHFPFCPPHPLFNENPRFHPHNDQFFQRPHFDPFLDPFGPAMNLHRPFIGHPGDGFGDRRPLRRSPSLDRDPYGQYHGQSKVGNSAMDNGVYRDGFGPPSYDHGGVGFKRIRVDDRDLGLFMGENHVNFSGIPSADERRLKLIRDHGSVPSGLPQGGANFLSGFNGETKGYMQENYVSKRSFNNMHGGEHEKFDGLRGGTNDMSLKPTSNFEMMDCQDPGTGYFDRKVISFHLEPGYNLHNYRGQHGLAFGQQYMQSNRNEELGPSHYGQVENSLPHSLHKNERSRHPDRLFVNAEQAQQSQDEAAPYHERKFLYNSNTGDDYLSVSHKADLKQRSLVSQMDHYPVSEGLDENYQNHNLQRIHPSNSMSMKELHYSHQSDWQGMSGSRAPYREHVSSFTADNQNLNKKLPRSYATQHPMQPNHDFLSPGQQSYMRQSVGVNVPPHDDIEDPTGHQNFPELSLYGRQNFIEEIGYSPIPTGMNVGPTRASRIFNVQPPLPASPPPPLPLDLPVHPYSEPLASSPPPKTSSSLFPIPVGSSADVPSSYPPVPEAHSLAQNFYTNKSRQHASTAISTEEFQACQASSKKYSGEGQLFPLRHLSSDNKEKVVDASHIFRQPHRATRPDHIVIILRGLPGSGKSYLAKILRDFEVENGGDAPRIHSMDDYFMTEVDKVDESDVSKSAGSVRGKKPVRKKVMEYCYEPELEEAYRSSMLKAFKKTLDEGVFSFIIVDDRNLRVADFAQFWATAKRSGYEVYLLEATYKDPAGCAARNVHGFTQDDIQKMARQWEEAPSLYLKLDIKSLLHGDGLEERGIQEVDMDTEEGEEERNRENAIVPPVEAFASDGPSRDDKRWYAEGGHPTEEVKELRRSKWSDDLDDDDAQRTEGIKGNSSALSGLIQAYSKEGKSVRWGDQVGNTGFSIGAAKNANVFSIVIGPGAGYNLKSNPLPVEENWTAAQNAADSKRQNIFQEQIRAERESERESFKAVFDKRRQRIGGLDSEEE